MFVLAPVNHLKNGVSERSRTLSHGFDHSSSWASASQNPSGSVVADSSSLFQSPTLATSTTGCGASTMFSSVMVSSLTSGVSGSGLDMGGSRRLAYPASGPFSVVHMWLWCADPPRKGVEDQSSSVERSPSSWPRARALRTLRMIFPERVFGSFSTKSKLSGLAIGESTSAT